MADACWGLAGRAVVGCGRGSLSVPTSGDCGGYSPWSGDYDAYNDPPTSHIVLRKAGTPTSPLPPPSIPLNANLVGTVKHQSINTVFTRRDRDTVVQSTPRKGNCDVLEWNRPPRSQVRIAGEECHDGIEAESALRCYPRHSSNHESPEAITQVGGPEEFPGEFRFDAHSQIN